MSFSHKVHYVLSVMQSTRVLSAASYDDSINDVDTISPETGIRLSPPKALLQIALFAAYMLTGLSTSSSLKQLHLRCFWGSYFLCLEKEAPVQGDPSSPLSFSP